MEVFLEYEAGNTSDKHKSTFGYIPCHTFRLIHSQPVTTEDSGFEMGSGDAGGLRRG